MVSSDIEVAVITGGASGIGLATAKALADRGARIALIDINQAALDTAEHELAERGADVLGLRADVTDPAAIRAAVETVAARWGSIHTVVTSAGIEYVGTVEQTPLDAFRRVLEISLVGTFVAAQSTLPYLRATRGSFTAIGSTTAVRGSSGWSAYSAAKHGVMGLIKSMALDHAREGVRINAVLPGFIQTPMAERLLEGLSEDELTATDNAIPIGRRALPSEVAYAVAHLSSAGASYVTGALYVVDGGTVAGFFEPPSI